ncbi:MAG TPA: O-antigen ligase family protein [Gaiellaceae bacterium]|nr:O-antigen ligase family protein [Gaiellaceae bacterium]
MTRVRPLPAAAPAARALPVAVVLVAAETIAWHDRGSIAAADFLPSSLAIAALAAVVLWSRAARRPPREALSALGLLTGLAVWAALSGFWAPVPSLARDEGLLVLTGAISFLVPLLVLNTPQDRLVALGIFTGAVTVLAIATVITLHGSTNVGDVFEFRRLSFPITYANATAGLLMAGVWPALLLAGRRAGAPAGRVLAFSTATLLIATSLLAQSKGAVLGTAASVLVVVAFSAARMRLVLVAVLASLPAALAFGRLTAAYDTSGAAEIRDVHRAATTLVLLALVAAVLGAVYVACDLGLDLGEARRRLVGRGVLALTVAAIVVGGGIVATSHPQAWLSAHWQAFKHPEAPGSASTHLVQLGSNRYDFWRVAVDEFRRHPLVGDGARGFGPAYLVYGRSSETPARAHSLPLELLGEEGIIGFLLAAGAFGLVLFGLVRRTRGRSAVATAALGGCVLLLAQACVDWTFTFPALTIPFFVLAGIGLADEGRRSVPTRAGRGGAALAALVALVVFLPPWLSAKLVTRGEAQRSTSDLHVAHLLDPVSVDPWLAEAQIATTPAQALGPLEQARARAPRSVEVRYLLGSAYWNDGKRAAAAKEYEAALALDPREPAIEQALRAVKR